MNVTEHAGGLLVEAGTYRLDVSRTRPVARLLAVDSRPVGEVALLAAVHGADGLDGAVRIEPVTVDGSEARVRLTVEAASTRWSAKRVVVECLPDELRVRVEVDGHGALADVHLLGGFHPGDRGWGSGFHRSRMHAATLFSPNPEDPRRVALGPGEPSTIGVVGGGQAGRGHWFFTPAPLCFGFAGARPATATVLPDGPWTMVGIAAPIEALTFTDLLYEPLDRGFALRLAYDGQTAVAGRWISPEVVIRLGAPDPYAGLATYRDGLVARGLAPEGGPARADRPPPSPSRPAWWAQPIFCGWGAQCHLATLDASHPADHATQQTYDRFLTELDARGINPGTIVIDDRWQRAYGTGEPDLERWPDLGAWIAARHGEGRRVLLWWKAWDPGGVPADLCVTTAGGEAVTVDPSSAAYRAFLGDAIRRLLVPPPDGLGADGLKIDFTALTPSGPGLRRVGPAWGIALLHALLAAIREAAHAARPDALLIAHAPNPAFADVADAVRLNDILRLDDPDRDVDVVAQMRHRAAVARAACPALLVETDDWGMPDRRRWREYAAMKADLGVPSLYYTTHLDLTGEVLDDEDAARIRHAWASYRAAHGLPEPAAPGVWAR